MSLWFAIFVLCYLQNASTQTSPKKPVLQSQQCQTNWHPYGGAQEISRSVSVQMLKNKGQIIHHWKHLAHSASVELILKTITETLVLPVSVVIGYVCTFQDCSQPGVSVRQLLASIPTISTEREEDRGLCWGQKPLYRLWGRPQFWLRIETLWFRIKGESGGGWHTLWFRVIDIHVFDFFLELTYAGFKKDYML